MKSIVNSKFKSSLRLNLNRSVYKSAIKGIRSVEGIRTNGASQVSLQIEDVVGLRSGKVGTVLLNKEHKSNVLSEAFMEDVRRSLEAMEIDEDMKVVVLKAKNDEVFSMGTDLNYLYCRKKSGEVEKIHEYYEKLYNFQNFLASYHKPLLALGNGVLKGSGVSMLSSSSHPMSTHHAQASFPEVGYGYVPDGGSVFFLSRLEGEMGAFLALTGYKLVDFDLVHLKLASDLTAVDLDVALSRRTFGIHFNESVNDWWEKWPETHQNYQNEKHKFNAFGVSDLLGSDGQKKMNYLQFNDTFQYPWERQQEGAPGYSSVYHSMVAKELNKDSSDAKFNYKDYNGRYFTNTAKQFLEIVYSGLPIMKPNHFSLVHVLKDIDRLFRFDTAKEILEALKNENSAFAEWCVAQLESKSALAMEATVKMLRNARTMNYYEIIKQEINVANNIVMKNPDFEMFMENKMNKNREDVTFPRGVNDITSEEIAEIFRDSKINSRINLDVKPDSLLPHNRYLNEHPDCFRLWINETPRVNSMLRKHFDYEIKNYLIHKFGIDLRDTNITIDEVRSVISKIETNKFTHYKNISKLGSLVSNAKFMQEYTSKRHGVIEKYQNDKDAVKLIVDKKLNKIFEDGLINKSKDIFKRCEEVRDLEKKRTWVRLKRWLFMNRIMEYKNKKKIVNDKRVDALGAKNLFIPYKLDTNYRDEVNPIVKKSPFYQLAGLFNLKKVTPEYAVRFATTNSNGGLFEFLELNKDKLDEIKEKLKSDPKAFIDVWNSALDKEAEAAFRESEDPTFVEYERVYRLRHEGHSTLDKLPYYKQYAEFKTNWIETKRKSTELLRKMTLDMIEDIVENEAVFNKSVLEVSQDKEAQKNLPQESLEDIRQLYNLVKSDESEGDLAFFNNGNQLDSIKIIKNNIDNVIKSDPFYQKLTTLSDKNGEVYSNFKDKVLELTQSLILNFLVNNDASANNIKQFNSQEIEANLKKLFTKESVSSNEFLNFLYANYGTQNIFAEVLKKSKYTAISVIKNLLENEIFMHNNKLLSSIKPGQIEKIKSIYEKEKSLLEDVLKKYYETKLAILNLDILSQEKASAVSMSEFVSTLKEITFSHLVLSDSKDLPKSFELLTSKIEEKNKERELVELYVNLNEVIDSASLSTSKSVVSHLSTIMKNSEWYKKVEEYVKTNDISENNLDSKVENFMKLKFNEVIYNNKINEVDYMVDKRKLNDIVKEKQELEHLRSLVQDYQSGKVTLSDDKDDRYFSETKTLETKINFYKQRNELQEQLNKMERQYNLQNLKSKYMDYIFNSNFYVHKVLCNIKNTDEIYTNSKDIQTALDYGKFLFEVKSVLDQTHFDLSKSKSQYEEFMPYDHTSRLRSLLFNQKNYVADLESLNNFIENKKKFTELIFESLYEELPFTSKFEVNLLVNDIQTDAEKLFNFLKLNKNAVINRQDFFIADAKFFSLFKNINFDEFVGLESEGQSGQNFSHLSELNRRIKNIFQRKLEEVDSNSFLIDRQQVDNLVRKLVTYEVAKGASEQLSQSQFDSLMTEVIEKERTAYADLAREGKIAEGVTVSSDVSKDAYLKELAEVAQVYTQTLSANVPESNSSQAGFNKCLNKNLADKLNVKVRSLSSKVLSNLQGLKHLQYIQNNKDKVMRDANNLYSLGERDSHATFQEFVKKQENPGLKFNKVSEILLGRKYSLQELILDDRQKTISDYGNDSQFEELFSNKLPVDLIKTALEVYDARIIKGLKLIFASENQKDQHFSIDNLIENHATQNYLNRKPFYFKGEESTFVNILSEVAADIEEEYQELKIDAADDKAMLGEIEKSKEEADKKLDEFKQDDFTFAVIDTEGSKVMLKYKKNSLFDGLINIHRLEAGKRKALGENILQKLNLIVPAPDFTSQYSVLKYIYDYYMGTLQVSYENYRDEAENRILELNSALRFERLEKVAKIDPMLKHFNRDQFYMDPAKNITDDSLNPKTDYNHNTLPVAFEREVNPIRKDEIESAYHIPKDKEHLYRATDKIDAKKIEHYKNVAFSIFYTKDPQNWRWVVSNGINHDYMALVDNELQRYFDVAHYIKLKREGKYEEESKRSKAVTMLLTEDFRGEASKAERSNKSLREKEFNTYDVHSIGFDHLQKQQKSEYDKVLDDMFGEYLKNKKEGLQYTKEKLQEQKEKMASFEQLAVTNPYEVLKKSQQAYFEMKSGSKDDSRMKMDLHTYLKASSMDKEYPTFFHSDITEIVDLDNATSRALHGKYASIPKPLVEEAEADVDSFHYNGRHILDKNEEEWFEDQIEKILSRFFEQRSHLEKTLTREELYAVDQDLLSLFTHENILEGVKKNLNKEVLQFNLYKDIVESERNGVDNKYRQTLKFANKQYEFNSNLKDENAYFQHLAYVYRLEKEHKDKLKTDLQIKKRTTGSTKPDTNITNPLEDPLNFENFYAKDLLYNQVYNDKRKEDPQAYLNKSKVREFSNLGTTQFAEGYTANEKFNHMKSIVTKVESNPGKVDEIYRKRAGEIVSILKEKADKIEQIDRFNSYMNSVGKHH